ncbi:MAG: hypothetical protein CM15mP8_3950 [Methanobacteriota archaeon]|nr:MAG: hypothetical protein CM15mP8_3950 [Euryarchaeota archaeon]
MSIPDVHEYITMGANIIGVIDRNGHKSRHIGRYLGQIKLDGAKPTATPIVDMLRKKTLNVIDCRCLGIVGVVDMTFALYWRCGCDA